MKGIPDVNDITYKDLVLSANRALLCEIRPNMRQVSVDYNKNNLKIIIYFYYNSPPSHEELDYDVFGVVSAEMSCDFPSEISWDEQVTVLPFPDPLPDKGICVYRRYEPPPNEK